MAVDSEARQQIRAYRLDSGHPVSSELAEDEDAGHILDNSHAPQFAAFIESRIATLHDTISGHVFEGAMM